MAADTRNTGTAEIPSGDPIVSNKKIPRLLGGLVVVLLALVAMGALARKITGSSDGGGSGRKTAAQQPTCFGGTFQVNAGEERQTVMGADLISGLGCMYQVDFTKPYLILAPAGSGRYNKFRDMSRLCGLPPGGLIRIRGLEDNTTVTFRFVGLLRDRMRCFQV